MATADKPALRAVYGAAESVCKSFDNCPPWATISDWVTINRGFRNLMHAAGRHLDPARHTALRIENDLACLGALFDELADTTCACCVRLCCRTARVWLDFKDLLFIHLSGQTLPAHQVRREKEAGCRFLSPRGCRLPRLSRPWVCTWYVCPAQRDALVRDVVMGEVRFTRLRHDVGRMRARMEDQFLRAVHSKHGGGDRCGLR